MGSLCEKFDASISGETVFISLAIPSIIIGPLVLSKKESSPIETLVLSVCKVPVPSSLPSSLQGLLSVENARVSPI